MYRSHTNDRGRRDNGRRGSSYDNDYRNRQRDYSDYRRDDMDRYEDDRYHAGNYGREEDDYGPFSNIYDNDPYRRGDFDTRYNDKRNYYYENGPRNDRSDEARGQSLSDVFSGGRRRSNSDRDYFTSYRSGNSYNSDPHYSLYGSDDRDEDRRSRYEDESYRAPWNEWQHSDTRNEPYRYREDPRRSLRNEADRDRSYHDKRRRYNEGYLY